MNLRLLRRGLLLALACWHTTVPASGFQPELDSLETVATVTLPSVVVAKALAEAPRKDRPFYFAAPVATQITLAHGSWDVLPGGEHRWRLRIASAGATSLSLHFAPFRLTPGASLWIYDESGALVHGPYRAANATRLGLWTPIIPRERLVIELRVPAGEAPALQLGIARAFHGFRDWKDAGSGAKAGSCNVDVACPTDGVWNDEVRSVARIQIDGSVLCSGQLLNNTSQNLDPLFLTADHCGVGETVNDAPAESAVFYWNYQASECNGSVLAPATTQSGSGFVADDEASDFTLLRLLAAPPPVAAVYYAGWNRSGNGSDCGVSIHHPNGDEKAISFYTTEVKPVSANIDGTNIKAWQVQRWTSGTTEAGSSGGGLWNKSHEVIGVLSGGDASCTNRSGSDFFGRLDEAWNPPGSTTSGQLKAHLDPGNTGRSRMPGRDPTQPPPEPATVTSTACGKAGTGQLGGGGSSGGGGGSGGPLYPALLAMLLLGAGWRRVRSPG